MLLIIVVIGLPANLTAKLAVCQTELEDVSNTVDEIVVVLANLLLVALQFPLLPRGPVIPAELQEVLFHVPAGVDDQEVR